MLLVSWRYHNSNKVHGSAKESSRLTGMCIDMTPAFLRTVALASLLILLTCFTAEGSEGQNTTCASTYYQFEEAAITNNSENSYKLFSTLYKPNQPLPYSVTVLYQVRLPNGTTQRISSDPNCSSELWLWTYSPVFLLAEPSLFNRITAYTINYFRRWKSPSVTLTVPLACEASTFGFLTRMTMSVSWEHTELTYTYSNACRYCVFALMCLIAPVCLLLFKHFFLT